MASSKTGFPSLEPAYVLKVNIGEIRPVGLLHTGQTHIHFAFASGTLTTVEGFEPKINATVEFGADWGYLDPDGATVRVNVKSIAKNEGDVLSVNYTGAIKVNDDIKLILDNDPKMHSVPFGQGNATHSFEAANPKYSKLSGNSWAGNSRFIVEDGKLSVESKISMIVPSTDAE